MCASCEDTDQPAHSSSLIRLFTGSSVDCQGYTASTDRQRGLLPYCENAQANLNLHLCVQSTRISISLISNNRLSRITAYLKEKIWFLFQHGNLTSGNKILWTRGEIDPKEQLLLLSTIFSIYEGKSISNQPIPFPIDRDTKDFHALFQYMF